MKGLPSRAAQQDGIFALQFLKLWHEDADEVDRIAKLGTMSSADPHIRVIDIIEKNRIGHIGLPHRSVDGHSLRQLLQTGEKRKRRCVNSALP